MKLLHLLAFLCISGGIFCQDEVSNHMVLIPRGEFTMGKNSENPTDWQPEHKVLIDSFYLDRYEVTNREYFTFCMASRHALPFFWDMEAFRCGMAYPDHPVVGVSYYDAEQYAKWANKRLPTEAEWEYASRGGSTGLNFPAGNSLDSTQANYGKKYQGTMKTGSFPSNPFGLFDMAGNVWEWTSDNYQGDYYVASPRVNPKGPERSRFKVIRGGSWHSGAMCNQTYYRNGLPPNWVDFAVGFRCARSIAE